MRRRENGSSTSHGTRTGLVSIFLTVLAAITQLGSVHGLIIHTEESLIASSSASVLIQDFGFKAGGSLSVTVEDWSGAAANVAVYLASCAEKKLDIMSSTVDGLGSYCVDWFASENASKENCFVEPLREQHRFEFTENTYARTVVVLCELNATETFKMTSVFMNPGGEHLGTEYIPVKTMYLSFIFMWTCAFAAAALFYWRRRNDTTWIHVLVLVAIVVRIAWLCAARAFWMHASKTSNGIPLVSDQFNAPSGKYAASLSYIVILALNQATMFLILSLISRGWLITRRRLEKFDLFIDGQFFIGLFTVNILTRLERSSVILITLYLWYPGVCAFILSNCSSNLKALRLQSLIVSHAQITIEETTVHAKENIFRSIQVLLFTYITTKIIQSLAELFLTGSDWLRYCIGESMDLVASLALARIVRPRIINPFNTHIVRDWTAMFEGTMNTIAERIAALGLSAEEVPSPALYVAEVGGERENLRGTGDAENNGVGCLHLILVEHPSPRHQVLENLAIALPDPDTQ